MGETSGSGQPIYRHTERASEPEAAFGDERLIEEITAHVERHLGPAPTVNHELISLDVHVDVLHVPPHDGRPCHTLVTCGMSAKPMPAAPRPDVARAELLVVLPPAWDLEDESAGWPFGILRFLAHLPHEYETWLGFGHTVPNGDPPEPYTDGTALCGAMLVDPTLVPDGVRRARARRRPGALLRRRRGSTRRSVSGTAASRPSRRTRRSAARPR